MPQFDPRMANAGFAVTQTLQDIMARRRAEAQQAFLDKLQQDEFQSVKAQREAAASNASQEMALRQTREARLAKSAGVEDQLNAERLFQSKLGNVGKGTSPQDIPDEEFRGEMEKRGQFKAQPMVGDSFNPQIPTLRVYPGTPAEQEKDDAEKRRQGLVGQFGAAKPNSPDQQRILLGLASEGVHLPDELITPRVPTQFASPIDGHIVRTDPNTLVPAERSVHMLEQPHQNGTGGLAGLRTKRYKVTFKDGEETTTAMNAQEYAEARRSGDVASIDEVAATGPGQDTASDRMVSDFTVAVSRLRNLADMQSNQGLMGRLMGSKVNGLEGAKTNAQVALNNLRTHADPALWNTAASIVKYPQYRDQSATDLAAGGRLQGPQGRPLTRAEIQKMDSYLGYLREFYGTYKLTLSPDEQKQWDAEEQARAKEGSQ
jgi:hypothetical protein